MNREISLHSSVHEVEFWKRYRALLRMMAHLESREQMIRELQEETAIPEKTRDEAVGHLKAEHSQNIGAFHDFLVNFSSLALQGLHRVDISIEFSFRDDGNLRCHRCVIYVDGRSRDLLVEEGQRLLSLLPRMGDELHPEESLIRFYEGLERDFDRNSRGELERCSLEVRQEIYPGSGFSAKIRLPAQVFLGNTE
ncbi:MAG TPA: hypothetical protein PK069_03255 [Methanolinea sp.]|nr:hypothetical protein [Methanolinea sp.]HQK55375.1 hypothetical protein [Methanolinea sp.]